MKYKNDLTAEYVRSIIDYNPDTGIFTWKISKPGIKKKTAGCLKDGYIVIRINGELYRAHRLAWLIITGKWPENEIDHINRIKDDNRQVNLREATHKQNGRNLPVQKRNRFGCKGIYIHKRDKNYCAQIMINGKNLHLGCYDDLKDAIRARKEAEIKYFGEFV